MSRVTTARKRGRPPLLTREQVLAASVELLQEAPLDAFTMQSVAKKLNVAPMTLYGYFPSRDALLQSVAEDVFGRLNVTSVRQVRDWRERVRLWCHIVHTQLIEIPELVRLINQPSQLNSTWLEASAPLCEAMLDARFSDERALFFTRWISRNLIGLSLFEGYMDAAVHQTPREHQGLLHAKLSPETYELYARVGPHAFGMDTRQLFKLSVESWITTLEQELANHTLETSRADARSTAPN